MIVEYGIDGYALAVGRGLLKDASLYGCICPICICPISICSTPFAGEDVDGSVKFLSMDSIFDALIISSFSVSPRFSPKRSCFFIAFGLSHLIN